MRYFAAVSTCALLLAGTAAWAADPSPIDRKFAASASDGNTFEIRSSRLALEQSQDPRVRAFARRMIDDHVMAQRKLEAASAMADTDSAPTLYPEHEAKIEALSQMSGADFDKAYLADQVEAHEMTSRALQDFSAGGYDPALLGWADKTLPVVNMHLAMARNLAGQ